MPESSHLKLSVKTPCIGVCSTGLGDSVCRGCKRFLHEVVDWNAYTREQQCHVIQRIEAFLDQIVAAKLEVYDKQKLIQFLNKQNIDCGNFGSTNAHVYALLKAGASQMETWAHYGISLYAHHSGKSPEMLRDEIDKEFYLLSCAHFERYFEVSYASD